MMEPVIVVGGARVFHGDCREALKHLPDNSVDSVVTDPPYELGFMGKKWDSTGIAYDVSVWVECLRVLKPGGHVLAFGGSRTFHRMAVAIEDAGFEIRDSIAWMYGTGFPKSLDVSKAIDKAAGTLKVVGQGKAGKTALGQSSGYNHTNNPHEFDITEPNSPEAQQWEGWGTALKPAFEPIVVGRKPFAKGSTVAANVLLHGVGGLNIDASRIGSFNDGAARSNSPGAGRMKSGKTPIGTFERSSASEPLNENQGRWPANVILDEYSAGLLDEQSGHTRDGVAMKGNSAGNNIFSENSKPTAPNHGYGGQGGASRFFYCAKASKRDRNEGLDEMEIVQGKRTHSGGEDTRGRPVPQNRNFHPTVKPTTLMRYLIKLVTPAGGTVLDPFTGSGSTGKAALLDGYKFIGAELTDEYLPIIEGRLRWAIEQEGETDGTLF